MDMAISGFLLLHHHYGYRRPPLFITGDTTRPPLITDPTTNLIELGFRATGRRGRLPMVGKGYGFQVTGDRVPDDRRIV